MRKTRLGLILIAIGLGLLVVPAASEPGRPRVAEGYAERVVTAGLLELPPVSASSQASSGAPVVVHDGRRRSEVGLLDVASALPGAMLAHAVRADRGAMARALGGALMPVSCFACIGAVFFSRLRRPSGLGVPAEAGVAGTLALLLGSSLLVGARRVDASLLATLLLLLLLDQLGPSSAARPRHFLHVGLLGAALTLAMPSYAGCALALSLCDLIRRGSDRRLLLPRALMLGLPVVLAVALVKLWDARVALAPAPSEAQVHALYGLLLSPGRSLFVYTPLALLGVCGYARLWARDRNRAESIAVAVCAALPAIAVRADWHGDPSFGPPQLLPLVPLLVEPAVLFLVGGVGARRAFAAFAGLGLLVQVLGLAVAVEAWPRLVSEVRAATGAPGWFLDPAADIEFVPQLSPIAGHLLLLRATLGRAMPDDPPFSLVVGSDQAEPGKTPAAWRKVWTNFDKSLCRSNSILVRWPRFAAWIAGLLALAIGALGAMLLEPEPARERRRPWLRG